ncbi:PKD domain-containing protein [Mucilaginibacter lacusdianchii]|uniref:PKD domain-containing protein n=1 Tax=Mucilaginibacter lacusdianchii TaxID=2684211 RepID=UPI00131E6383|nr:PKD domain-containing protein [Mucilaginibacter sp. JXJ CY 39]
MKINIKALVFTGLAVIAIALGCKKPEYSFGKLVTPTDLTLATSVAGVDATNPNGNGSGNVSVSFKANNALTYKVDYGDGNTEMVQTSGQITHRYTSPGIFSYNVTVSAVGTGGAMSTLTQKVTVFVAFEIPAAILDNLTGGSSKTWVSDRLTPGHVGVGPTNTFTSDYYSAEPNQRAECLYDDEITFTKDANNNVILTVNNKGQSFMTAAATASYGKAGGDDCYDYDLAAPRKLAFMDATSTSTPAQSTRIQFTVPGAGLINFGTGGNTYEIIALTANTITLRNIGSDGLAWYQKLKVK